MNQGDDRNSIIHHSSFIILPLAAGAVIVAAIAIAQRWWPIGVPYPWSAPGKFRATSVFGYPNAVGLFLGPIVVLSFGAAMRLFQWRQQHGAGIKNQESGITGTASISLFMMHNSLFFILTSAIAVVAIVFARSTGALVALVVAPFVFVGCMWFTTHTFRPHYPIFHDRRKWDSRRNGWAMRGASRWAAVVIAGWVAASLVLTAWLPYRGEQPTWGSPIVQKLTFQKWSGSVRLSQYRETWQLLRDHPIRGAGLAGYQTAIRPYHEKKDVEIFLYPHNLLLAVWVELGLAGLLLFLTMLYQLFRRAFIIHHSSFIIPVLLVLLIHGLVDVPYLKNDLAMLFWVIVALAVGTGVAFEKSRATT